MINILVSLTLALGSFFNVQALSKLPDTLPAQITQSAFLDVDNQTARANAETGWRNAWNNLDAIEWSNVSFGSGVRKGMGSLAPLLTSTYTHGLVVTRDGTVIDGADITNVDGGVCLEIRANNVTVRNSYIHDCVDHGVRFLGGIKGGLFENNEITRAAMRYKPGQVSSGWPSLLKVQSTDESPAGIAEGIIIRNNYIHEGYGECMGLRGTNLSVEGNFLKDCYSVGLYANSDHAVVKNNFVLCTGNPEYNRDGLPMVGIGFAEESFSGWTQRHGSWGQTVINNIVSGCKYGFRYGSSANSNGLKDTVVAFNTFYATTNAAISVVYYSSQANVTIHNNIASGYSLNMNGISYLGNVNKTFSAWGVPEDFKLATALPAIGSYQMDVDFSGNFRNPPLDAGAWEYNGVNVTQTLMPQTTTSVSPTMTITPTLMPTSIPITATSTPTPTSTQIAIPWTATPIDLTPTPLPQTPAITPTSTVSPPTLPGGISVITSVVPDTLLVGETGLVSVSLNGLPSEGIASVEFTCSYASDQISVGSVQIGEIFGNDPVSAYNNSQTGRFIYVVAASNGKAINTNGMAFTFTITGLQPGASSVECKANIFRANYSMESIASVPDSLTVILFSAPTATPLSAPMLTGQVIAKKPVTISLLNPDTTLAATAMTNPDGSFNLIAPAGSFTVIASAEGYLNAQASVTLLEGTTTTLSPIALPAGDIDSNNIIDQYDALTVGMNYNVSTSLPADLSNDGLINAVDLVMLAENYRLTGVLNWQQP